MKKKFGSSYQEKNYLQIKSDSHLKLLHGCSTSNCVRITIQSSLNYQQLISKHDLLVPYHNVNSAKGKLKVSCRQVAINHLIFLNNLKKKWYYWSFIEPRQCGTYYKVKSKEKGFKNISCWPPNKARDI